jgi:predicted SnoaL-like aldol condensation-catalyzing enzyme
MKLLTRITLVVALSLSCAALAQLPVVAGADQTTMLASPDPKLAANKRLVYDFWREVFEGGHMDAVDRYLSESYVQHNPNVPTGRAGFVAVFSKFAKPVPTVDRVKAPLVAIVAEGDLVILSFAKTLPDPAAPDKTYTTTWFDMFRVENGRIAEHWDPALKPAKQ